MTKHTSRATGLRKSSACRLVVLITFVAASLQPAGAQTTLRIVPAQGGEPTDSTSVAEKIALVATATESRQTTMGTQIRIVSSPNGDEATARTPASNRIEAANTADQVPPDLFGHLFSAVSEKVSPQAPQNSIPAVRSEKLQVVTPSKDWPVAFEEFGAPPASEAAAPIGPDQPDLMRQLFAAMATAAPAPAPENCRSEHEIQRGLIDNFVVAPPVDKVPMPEAAAEPEVGQADLFVRITSPVSAPAVEGLDGTSIASESAGSPEAMADRERDVRPAQPSVSTIVIRSAPPDAVTRLTIDTSPDTQLPAAEPTVVAVAQPAASAPPAAPQVAEPTTVPIATNSPAQDLFTRLFVAGSSLESDQASPHADTSRNPPESVEVAIDKPVEQPATPLAAADSTTAPPMQLQQPESLDRPFLTIRDYESLPSAQRPVVGLSQPVFDDFAAAPPAIVRDHIGYTTPVQPSGILPELDYLTKDDTLAEPLPAQVALAQPAWDDFEIYTVPQVAATGVPLSTRELPKTEPVAAAQQVVQTPQPPQSSTPQISPPSNAPPIARTQAPGESPVAKSPMPVYEYQFVAVPEPAFRPITKTADVSMVSAAANGSASATPAPAPSFTYADEQRAPTSLLAQDSNRQNQRELAMLELPATMAGMDPAAVAARPTVESTTVNGPMPFGAGCDHQCAPHGCPYLPGQSGATAICGVDCGGYGAPCCSTWNDARCIPWSVFGPGEYVGPARTAHVSTYYLRVNDIITLTYITSRRKEAERYRIGCGDRLRIEWLRSPSNTDASLDREVIVQPDGTVAMPLVGEMNAAGKTIQEVRDELVKEYGQFQRDPQITVTPLEMNLGIQDIINAVTSVSGSNGQTQALRVTPEGTIQAPGLGSVHVQGLTLDELRGELEARYAATFGPGLLVSPSLTERATTYVFVGGEVKLPARYPLEGPTTVMQAITLAGGWNVGGNLHQVVVFRRDENWCLKATKIDIRAPLYGNDPCPANDIWLRDSDLVIVPKSKILCATDVVQLYFTRGIYAVVPISYVYDFSASSGIVPVP